MAAGWCCAASSALAQGRGALPPMATPMGMPEQVSPTATPRAATPAMWAGQAAVGAGARAARSSTQRPSPPTAGESVARREVIWQRYHTAVVLLGRGDVVRAQGMLQQLRGDAPGSPVDDAARRLLDELDRLPPQRRPAAVRQRQRQAQAARARQRRRAAASLQLYASQMAHGLVQARLACVALDCPNRAVATSAQLGGIALGGVVPWLILDGRPADPALAQAAGLGTVLGFFHGFKVTNALPDVTLERAALRFSVLQAGGVAVAMGTAWATEATSGQIATAGTGAFVGGGLAWFADRALRPDASTTSRELMPLLGADLGLALGALTAPGLGWSRTRAWLIDAGAVLGSFIGGSLGVVVSGVGRDNPKMFGGAFVGAVLGVGAGVALTDEVTDAPGEPGPLGAMQLLPPPRGDGLMMGFGGAF